jgi:hypothetical protein
MLLFLKSGRVLPDYNFMNLATTIALYCDGSSLVNSNPDEDRRVIDRARRRLVKTNPDVDANMVKLSPDSQTDNAGFTGKKYRVVDISYGHNVSEHDSTASAEYAAQGRPYSKVIGRTTTDGFQLTSNQKVRDMVRNKLKRSLV